MPVVTLIPDGGSPPGAPWSATSTGWGDVDEDPDSPNDADYVQAAGASGIQRFAFNITATPTNFLSAVSAEVRVRWSVSGHVDDALLTNVIVSSSSAGGNVPWSNTGILTQNANQSITTATIPLTLNSAGLAASKADWDNALLGIDYSKTQSMSSDSVVFRVYALRLFVTYIASGRPRQASITSFSRQNFRSSHL